MVTIGMPTRERSRFAASGLFTSLPGLLTQTITPQKAPPQGLKRTRVSPDWLSQVPRISSACAGKLANSNPAKIAAASDADANTFRYAFIKVLPYTRRFRDQRRSVSGR